MKQVFLAGSGQVEVFDVPLVGRMADAVLVQNAFSLISTGTEGAAVASKRGLLGTCEKLWASSHRLRDVWNMARTTGMAQALEAVRSKLTDHTPLGYSSAGQVVEIDGPELPFTLGQRVACMGTGFANHAEFIAVPKNLAVPVPENVSLEEAAFGAIGCIALQGIRRLELSPGERIGVIGLGLIGQVCVRLLAAMGYQTYGLDLSRPRAQKASEVPGVAAWATDALDSVDYLRQLTDGEMLDGVVVCAAAKSSVPINLAFDLCRQRGRVSVVGDVGLDLERPKMYRKEIEVRLSCSYGPGRYDNQYELGGQDYPHGYVRWTERRNLEFFLSMLAAGRLSVRPLINAQYPVDRADEAYRRIKQADPATFGVLLDYGMPAGVCKPVDPSARVLRLASAIHLSAGSRIGLGLIGVGGYAKGVHIPNLKKLYDEVEIRGAASLSGGSAAIVARKLGARFATGDYRKLLEEPGIDAVLICTRHASHARIALEALRAGKHVFVEKPLATTVEDAEQVVDAARASGLVVRVGFNRRFSPYLNHLRQAVGTQGRRMLVVRVNVGDVSRHWSNTLEEGGRLLGEGVHFFDFCNWFMGATPVETLAAAAGPADVDNPNAGYILRYPDGSLAQVTYTSLGHPGLRKEYYEAFGNGRAARCNDFQTIEAFGTRLSAKRRERGDKGQLGVLEEFLAAVRGRPWPIAGADAEAGRSATAIALAVQRPTVSH